MSADVTRRPGSSTRVGASTPQEGRSSNGEYLKASTAQRNALTGTFPTQKKRVERLRKERRRQLDKNIKEGNILNMSDEERALLYRETSLMRKRRSKGHLGPAEADELRLIKRLLLGRKVADVRENGEASASSTQKRDHQVTTSQSGARSSSEQSSSPTRAESTRAHDLRPATPEPDYDAIFRSVENPHLFDAFESFTSTHPISTGSLPPASPTATSRHLPFANSQEQGTIASHGRQASTST